MENLGAAGHDEGDGFDVGVVDRLEGPHHLVLVHVDAALGEEGDAALGVGGFVFGEGFEFVVLVLEIADVAVSVVARSSVSARELKDEEKVGRGTLCRPGTSTECRHPRRACRHLSQSRVSQIRPLARRAFGRPRVQAADRSFSRSLWWLFCHVPPSRSRDSLWLLRVPVQRARASLAGHPIFEASCLLMW